MLNVYVTFDLSDRVIEGLVSELNFIKKFAYESIDSASSSRSDRNCQRLA